MGFSKYKKFLYILMIISILINIYNKVFAVVNIPSTVLGESLELPNWIYDYNFYIGITNLNNNTYGLTVILFDKNVKIYYTPTQTPIRYADSLSTVAERYVYDGNRTKTSLLNFIKNLQPSDLTHYTNLTNKLSFTVYRSDIPFEFYTNFDIYYSNNHDEIYHETNAPDPYIYPHFLPGDTDIQNLDFDKLYIEPGDYGTSDPLYVHLLEVNQTIQDDVNIIYYYSDTSYALTSDGSYINELSGSYYYGIPRYKLNFQVNKEYYLILNNNSDPITNSVGVIEKDTENQIFESIYIDTTNKLTQDDVNNNILLSLSNDVDDMNDNTPNAQTENEIDDALSYDNNNQALTNMNNGFFTRLTTMLSNLLGYDLSEDTIVSIPLPYSDKSLVLHSNITYNNVNGALRLIINAFWVYIFTFYMWKFINKIYIAISTGNILDTFSSSGEAITNDML